MQSSKSGVECRWPVSHCSQTTDLVFYFRLIAWFGLEHWPQGVSSRGALVFRAAASRWVGGQREQKQQPEPESEPESGCRWRRWPWRAPVRLHQAAQWAQEADPRLTHTRLQRLHLQCSLASHCTILDKTIPYTSIILYCRALHLSSNTYVHVWNVLCAYRIPIGVKLYFYVYRIAACDRRHGRRSARFDPRGAQTFAFVELE